jgi:hypothetical protein
MKFTFNIIYLKRLTRSVILIVFLILFSFTITYGQKTREEPPQLKERLFFGGNFGLQFGTITDIQVSPVVGIWILPRSAVAAGPDFRFYKFYDERTTIYGGKGYLQFLAVQNLNSVIPLGLNTGIFLQLEDELMSLESAFWKDPPYTSNRFYINTVLAGGGISQQIGRRSSMNITFLWALNEPEYAIYGTPEIRVSFIF